MIVIIMYFRMDAIPVENGKDNISCFGNIYEDR